MDYDDVDDILRRGLFLSFFYDFRLWAYILCNNINYGLYFYEGIFGFHGIQSWGFTGVKD